MPVPAHQLDGPSSNAHDSGAKTESSRALSRGDPAFESIVDHRVESRRFFTTQAYRSAARLEAARRIVRTKQPRPLYGRRARSLTARLPRAPAPCQRTKQAVKRYAADAKSKEHQQQSLPIDAGQQTYAHWSSDKSQLDTESAVAKWISKCKINNFEIIWLLIFLN